MTNFKVGDRVRLTGADWGGATPERGTVVTISDIRVLEEVPTDDPVPMFRIYGGGDEWFIYKTDYEDWSAELVESPPDAVNPSHYQFPNGAEVRFISEWLTANAAQALQYIARSSRIDGQNKGNAVEDIRKAIKFLGFELERLGG